MEYSYFCERCRTTITRYIFPNGVVGYHLCITPEKLRALEKGLEMIDKDKRIDYWDYLINEKVKRPKGVTDKRLEKIKSSVMADDDFWFQVISRFGADRMTAVEFYQEERRSRSDDSRSQFWSMLRERI